MQKLAALLLPLLCIAADPASLPFTWQSSAQTSSQTSMRATAVDSHEGLTIGVDPWTVSSRYKEKFPKKSPYSAGIVALKLSFRNETDEGIRVDLRRIRLVVQLSEDNRQELASLTPDEVADTLLLQKNGKDPTVKRIPLPVPLGKVPTTRDKNWIDFRDTCQDAGIPSPVIAAHSTVEGLIYFDIRGEWDLLQTSRLYVPGLITMSSKEPLSYFDIDLGHANQN
jgi:hypothetical protein